jgi:hypothetical protein
MVFQICQDLLEIASGYLVINLELRGEGRPDGIQVVLTVQEFPDHGAGLIEYEVFSGRARDDDERFSIDELVDSIRMATWFGSGTHNPPSCRYSPTDHRRPSS